MAKAREMTNGQREVPPLMLLALVSQFLADNGFNSSHRIFDTERRKRPKKEGWTGTFGASYTAKYPTLDKIFTQWENEHAPATGESSDSEAASSEEEPASSDDSSEEASSSDESSSEGSESEADDGSDIDMKDVKEVQQAADASSSSEDESESESEEEVATKVQEFKSATTNSLKRKAPETSSESSSDASSSESDSDSSEDAAPPAKKAKVEAPEASSDSESESDASSSSDSDDLEVAANTALPASDSSDDSSSQESSEDSSSDDDDEDDTPKVNGTAAETRASSASSGTITGEVQTDTIPQAAIAEVVAKRRHIGAHPTRLAMISATADPTEFISNEYVSYEYADRAYKDLSVTRGKGFTKEKNKKKRGSYRGGPIDTSGGKGIKFDD